jgi:hypothetical protein
MDLIQASRELAVSEIEKFGLPSQMNFEISEKKAIELAEKLNADKTIVQVGVYLMDLKLGQAFKENKPSQHVQMSVEAAREFLNKLEIDEISKQKILNCVEAHHNNVPFICIEAEICANADCYRFIHPKGFFGYLISLGKNNDFSECLIKAENKMDEKHNILSLDICKKELEECYHTLKKYIRDARNL